MPTRQPRLRRRLSHHLSCAADDAERLGLHGITRALHEWSFRMVYGPPVTTTDASAMHAHANRTGG